ncbi:MAG: hypothetical protein PHU61_02730 [Candidatus Absconditabacteria bacterium]|nr:hypothetical protein [Candidatus Absconditabacteria bacterium]MDD3868651.1 hypothetical protein [Candidatus Absconditabacteria bacterium]MDD4714498.1 hypothetical protein [Candidatus Absconditabacteria bacterium]
MRNPLSQNKEELYSEIIDSCNALPIAQYLKHEVESSLKYFHQYKLHNIKKNLNMFCDYLLFLNEENGKQILELTTEEGNKELFQQEISYFFVNSEASEEELGIVKAHITNNPYQVLSLMQGVKGLLLLTIDEFCNASPTRMAINSFVFEKETKKKQKKKSRE